MKTSRKLVLAIFAVAIGGLLGSADRGPAACEERQVHGQIRRPRFAERRADLRAGKRSCLFSWAEFTGYSSTTPADGFLDKTEVTCPVVEDIANDLIVAMHGYCTMTDKDGDKAFLVWRCKGTPPGSYAGTFEWTGGTGKFQGLQGNNNFHGSDFGKRRPG